jgi:hypothetical protein
MIGVRLQRHSGIEAVYPISVYTSTDKHKFKEEIALVREMVEFLSTNFEFVEYDEEVKVDVYAKELDKYTASCVNEAVHVALNARDVLDLRPHRPDDFDSADFINEMTVVRGIIHLPGEEKETLSALIKLYFTDRDIVIVES